MRRAVLSLRRLYVQVTMLNGSYGYVMSAQISWNLFLGIKAKAFCGGYLVIYLRLGIVEMCNM